MKKLSTQDFINKAIIIHGDKYNYSLVKYSKSKDIIKIICKIHGEFEQIANNHLCGKGCRKCFENSQKMTINNFIIKSNEIHSFKYDYYKSLYKNSTTKVIIICKIHGDFLQTPSAHLAGHGCIFCRSLKIGDTLSDDLNKFIEKANIIHDHKYDYNLTDYKKSRIKVKIICKIHGEFLQSPNSHLIGKGCKKCAIFNSRLSNDEFVNKSTIIHNDKYDYSRANYLCNKDKVLIVCKYHGEFEQVASSHLSGNGCPNCSSFVSKAESKWLDLLMIPLHCRNKRIFIGEKRYNVDAYDPITNTVYEFYGDYWHGNPKKFKRSDIHPIRGISFGELYDKTIDREKFLKSKSYNVISIWEFDFNKSNRIIEEII